MVKSSRLTRVLMAAGLYVLLMWGYLELPAPQLFAVFSALIMCIALLFWVNEARAVERLSRALKVRDLGYIPGCIPGQNAGQIAGEIPSQIPGSNASKWMQAQCDATYRLDIDLDSYDSSVERLDALRDELSSQYAQFGRDQSAMNLKGLGAWHRK